MQKKKLVIQESIKCEYNQEYSKGLEECKLIERELLEKKDNLYEALRGMDN